ncbi:MAG TPA: alpha/beta fold hydrolase [Stellaceae bacterium]|nr:alpha/beta fold hydrolase [Stellaceae bacterium]
MPTFVLIHGAYQGGWIWQPTASRLRAKGHLAYAPSLDGCADRRGALRPGITTESHAAEIADLLYYEDLHEVVLVGTSAGGMVLCRAAELTRERILRLVFVDALALLDGERIADIVHRSTPRVATALATGPSREDAEARLFADLEPAMRAWALARYTPHPIAAMEEPVKLDGFWDTPWRATVIRCRRAANPPEAHHRRTAERLKAPYVELDTGHYPMLSMPDELTRLLLEG